MKKFNYKKTENEISKKEFGKLYNELNKTDKQLCDMFVCDIASNHYTH